MTRYEVTLVSLPCDKCNATGYIPPFAHVQGGICFRCRGTRIMRVYQRVDQLPTCPKCLKHFAPDVSDKFCNDCLEHPFSVGAALAELGH
jgi:hypothetical protein